VGHCRRRDLSNLDPTVAILVPEDAPCSPAEQGERAVLVSPEEMGVAGAELGQALEELSFGRLLGLLPARLPRLVGREESAGVPVLDAELVVPLQRERVVVLQLERVPGVPWLRPPQLVARALRLRRRVGPPWTVGLRSRRSLGHRAHASCSCGGEP